MLRVFRKKPRTRKECVCDYLSGVLAPHRLTYWTRERRLDFRHRAAKLGAVDVNAIWFGGDVMVAAPDLPTFISYTSCSRALVR